MEIEYFGGNCIRLSSKKASLVIDDNLTELGLKSITNDNSVAIVTSPDIKAPSSSRLIIEMPGEYEVSNVSITGVAAKPYLSDDEKKTSTMYKIIMADIRILVTGNILPELSDNQAEEIGTVDVLIVPVGNNETTLNGKDALKIAQKIEPKMIIPTNYSDKGVKYQSPVQSLDEAITELSMEVKERTNTLKLKPADLTDTLQLVVVKRS